MDGFVATAPCGALSLAGIYQPPTVLDADSFVHARQFVSREQMIDDIRDAHALALRSHQRNSASGDARSGDRRDVVASGHAVASTTDPEAERVGHERAIDDQLLRLIWACSWLTGAR
jgi:hypothetical protein